MNCSNFEIFGLFRLNKNPNLRFSRRPYISLSIECYCWESFKNILS